MLQNGESAKIKRTASNVNYSINISKYISLKNGRKWGNQTVGRVDTDSATQLK